MWVAAKPIYEQGHTSKKTFSHFNHILMKNIIFILLCATNALFAQPINFSYLQKARNYARIEMPDCLGFRLISTDAGYDIFSFEGQKVNKQIYVSQKELQYGYYGVTNNQGQKYLLDPQGNILFSHDYESITPLREGIFEVEKERKMGIVNAKNEIMLELKSQFIYPLYNANAFPSTDIQTLFEENFEAYPCDSFIVSRNDSLLLYNAKNEKVLVLGFNSDFTNAFRLNLPSHSYTFAPYEKRQQFILQKNRLIMQDYGYKDDPLWVEWTINKDSHELFFPRPIFPKKPEQTHFYCFLDDKTNEKTNDSSRFIIDEKGNKVLEGKWARDHYLLEKFSGEYIDGYLILEKELVGIRDSSYEEEDETPANPLLIESCKDTSKKQVHWKRAFVLIRLADKKEIMQVDATWNSLIDWQPAFAFLGNNKCIVREKEKVGVIDLEGKWLIPPIYDNFEFVSRQVVSFYKGDSSFLINDNLEIKKIERGFGPEGVGNSIYYTFETLVGADYPFSPEKEWFKVTFWKGFTPIYHNIVELNNNNNFIEDDLFNSPDIFWKTDKKGKKEGVSVLLEDGSFLLYPITDRGEIVLHPKYFELKVKKWGVIDKKGKQIVPFLYDEIEFWGNYFTCAKADMVDYIDIKGNLLFTKPATEANQNLLKSAKIQAFCKGNGYIIKESARNERNFRGFKYEPNVYFQKGKAYYKESEIYFLYKFPLFGYINAEGKEIIPPIYTKLVKINATTVIGTNSKVCEKINLLTLEKEKLPFSDLEVHNSYILAKKDSLFAFANADFKPTSDFIYKSIWGGYLNYFEVSNKEGKVGLLSGKDRKIVIPLKYEQIEYNSRGGRISVLVARVDKETKIDLYTRDSVPLFLGTYEELKDYNWKYLCVKKKGKWGVINYKGKIIVPFLYDDEVLIQLFRNGEKKVLLRKATELLLYSHLGKLIWKGSPNADTEEWQNFYFIKQNGEVRILDSKGKVRLSYKGKIRVSDENAKCAIATFDTFQKANLLNTNLQKILPWDCDSIEAEGNFFIIYQEGKGGIADSSGNVLFSPENSPYQHIEGTKIKATFLANLGKKQVYIRPNGKLLFPNEYDFYKIVNANKCIVAKNGKAGCIDSLGKVLVPLEWENLGLLEKNENLYLGRKDCEYYLLDKKGREMLPDSYKSIYQHSSDVSKISISKGEKEGLIDTNANVIIPCQYDKIDAMRTSNATPTKYYVVTLNGKKGLYSSEGEKILAAEYKTKEAYFDEEEGLILMKDSLQGYFSSKTRQITPVIYKNIEPHSSDTKNVCLIATLPDDKMILLEDDGTFLLPKTYDKIEFEAFVTHLESELAISYNSFIIYEGTQKSRYYFQYGKWHWELM